MCWGNTVFILSSIDATCFTDQYTPVSFNSAGSRVNAYCWQLNDPEICHIHTFTGIKLYNHGTHIGTKYIELEI